MRLAVTIRRWLLATLAIIVIKVAAPADPHDHLVDLLEGRGPLLRLHLHNVQLLWRIKTEQRRLSLEDLHAEESSLGVHLLDRAGKEGLEQCIEPLQAEPITRSRARALRGKV